MNVFSFTGNLGRDVTTNNVGGSAVANFTVAVKSGYGDKEQTVWVDCALWGSRAEGGLIQYLNKGQQVAVHGELGTREWQNDAGETKTTITCRVNDVTLIGKRDDSSQQQPRQPRQQPAQQSAPNPAPAFDDDDSIPF